MIELKTKGSVRLSDEIREKVKIMAIQGHSEPYIAKNLHIATSSAHRIKKETDNLDSLRQNKKEQIVKRLWEIVLSALNSITDEKIKEMSAYQIMVTAAVGVDKAQLLSGGATDILQVRTEKELDRELTDLESAERELKEAWLRAEKKRKAEEKGKETGKQISQDSTNGH